MILTHIITKDKKQALQIIKILIKKKLLFHVSISRKTVYQQLGENEQLEPQKQVLIMGKTKALLFNMINQELKNNFPENMPMLYAVPIIYMDEEHASILRANTAKV